MTIADRLEQLQAMLLDEPQDRFLRYAIALEHKRKGDMGAAVQLLEQLLTEDATYIACYYQLALIQAEMGHGDEAVKVCTAGALQCLVAGDMKTRAELLSLKAAVEEELGE